MIYLEETFNLAPASPETLDTFVEFAQAKLVPSYDRLGARLVAAWYADVEAFSQVRQVLEFDDLTALGAFRTNAAADHAWMECENWIEEVAPVRRSRLMEALAAIPPETLRQASAESQKSPVGAYSLAILEVAPGKMP